MRIRQSCGTSRYGSSCSESALISSRGDDVLCLSKRSCVLSGHTATSAIIRPRSTNMPRPTSASSDTVHATLAPCRCSAGCYSSAPHPDLGCASLPVLISSLWTGHELQERAGIRRDGWRGSRDHLPEPQPGTGLLRIPPHPGILEPQRF